MSLAACSAQTPPVITAPQSETRIDTPSSEGVKTNTRIDNPQFSDVLEKYKTLNQRLLRLLAPLRLSNEHLCPKTERDPGFITHKLKDYPPHMRIMAQDVLGLSDKGIFIRSVRRGSPAHNAQIQEGDEVLAINGQIIANRPSPSKFYKALSRNAFNSEQTYMTLKPPQGPVYETSLRAQTACDMQGVVIFSEDINGQTDGEEIFITSALMSSVGDDLNLSLVLAHEMAHIIAEHTGQTPTAQLELEADRMALVLMQNAGLDIGKAIGFWRDEIHPHIELQNTSGTHPSINERYENFRKEQARIQAIVERDQELGFE